MPVRQREVLELIAERGREGKTTSYRSLVNEWDLSEAAACRHLERLWRERLIETREERLGGFQFRLGSGEMLRDLRFQITPRGRERLRWYARQDRQEKDWLW